MKSTFFKNDLEFSIDIKGDNWKQGDTISGNVSISGKSNVSSEVEDYGLFLCNGNAKKIKAQDSKGLAVIDELLFSSTGTNDFSFKLDLNSSITEKSVGPYIVCAHKENLLEGQHLIMQVTVSDKISKVIEVIENYLRFKVKGIKSKKKDLEYTFKIPSTTEYRSISSFKLLTHFDENNLELKYIFKTKKVVFENGNTTTKDELKSFEYSLAPSDYLFHGDSVDQDKLVKHFNEVLDQVKLKPFL